MVEAEKPRRKNGQLRVGHVKNCAGYRDGLRRVLCKAFAEKLAVVRWRKRLGLRDERDSPHELFCGEGFHSE